MIMRIHLAVLPLLTFVAGSNLQARQADTAQTPSTGGSLGFGSSGGLSNTGPDTTEDDVEQLFESAGRQPNVSSSVTFDLSPGTVRYDQSGWTWRVNITDLAVPEQILSGDYRIVNEQWELQWPGGGSLESLLAQHAGYNNDTRSCVSTLRYRLPANVTSRYAASDNGNCTAVLGPECAQRLRHSAYGGCDDSARSLANAMECAETLGLASHSRRAATGFNASSPFDPGDTVYYWTSPAVPSTNATEYFEERETDLKILFLHNLPGTSDIGSTVLCQVVNPSASSAAGMHQGLAHGSIMWMVCVAMGWVLFLS